MRLAEMGMVGLMHKDDRGAMQVRQSQPKRDWDRRVKRAKEMMTDWLGSDDDDDEEWPHHHRARPSPDQAGWQYVAFVYYWIG